ncbi:MAG TPA: HAD-IIIA family hydrolase [Marmoricola sp.]|nr:HAD-IIIA family hydrolase [Marmoricola sp.]
MTTDAATTLVIPTVGRPSLRTLLEALARGTKPVDCPVLVVDDRPVDDGGPLEDSIADVRADLPGLRVLRSGGGGPARARNLGWRHGRTPWVSFLDDDVVPTANWYETLLRDLHLAPASVAGVQGNVEVPLPTDRRPTDWERSTAGLESSTWITADLSYRRSALVAVGGFDERFPRAFREDADLGLRVTTTVGPISRGVRRITHPARPADDWVSVRQQAGNADDFLMRRLHGPRWRDLVHAPSGRRPRHVATATAAVLAAGAAVAGRRGVAAVAAAGWLAGTGELAWARIAPGPRDRAEVVRMLKTSAVMPFAATWHSARGVWRHRAAGPWRRRPDLVLFDRDGTLVHDVPYNGDPAQVRPVADARDALDRLRGAGIRVGVVSNQSAVGTGRITRDQMDAVNRRVEELLGPFDVWEVCPHAPHEGCACRKPAPGLVKAACQELGVPPERCVVIGDIGSDVEAAHAAGARGVLVPTAQTRPDEVVGADRVADSLSEAVERVLEPVR